MGRLLAGRMRGAEPEPRDDAGRRCRHEALAEMANVRDALAWCTRHDRATAVELAISTSLVATFTPWRVEASDWLAACQPGPDDGTAPGRQAMWWRMHATMTLFRGRPEAAATACRAVAVCRDAGEPLHEFWSLVALARASAAPDAHLDDVTAAIEALLASHPEWPPQTRNAALGTQAVLCLVRHDYAGALRYRQAELELARAAGLARNAAAAEYNLAFALARLGRHDEARERLQAMVEAHRDDADPNLVYARLLLLRLRVEPGPPADAALAAAIRADAVDVARLCRRHAMLGFADLAPLLALRFGRPRAAALLLGHAAAVHEALDVRPSTDPDDDLPRGAALLSGAFAPLVLQALVERGRSFGEAAADALLVADGDAA
jgi:tetratricopeptide (TPR) repeat protein